MIALEKVPSPHGLITVYKNRKTGAYSYEQGSCLQSEADSSGVSLAPYIHAIFDLLQQQQAKRVLMIGGAGGTLATLLCRAGSQVTVVDTDATAFALARSYFQLPNEVNCTVADGFEYLKGHNTAFDAIVLDAYVGDRIPPHLFSLSFLSLVKSRLHKTGGAFFANVYTDHDFDLSADEYFMLASGVWGDVRLLDSTNVRNRNTILLAGAVSDLRKPKMKVMPDTFPDELEFELNHLKFRSCRLDDSRRSNARFRRLFSQQVRTTFIRQLDSRKSWLLRGGLSEIKKTEEPLEPCFD